MVIFMSLEQQVSTVMFQNSFFFLLSFKIYYPILTLQFFNNTNSQIFYLKNLFWLPGFMFSRFIDVYFMVSICIFFSLKLLLSVCFVLLRALRDFLEFSTDSP